MELGHNDPWVDCTYHLNRYGVKFNITMIAYVIAKVGKNRLVEEIAVERIFVSYFAIILIGLMRKIGKICS